MGRDQIRARVGEILGDIVDEPGLVLTDADAAEDFPWWDSLNHLKLLVALESDMRIKFQLAELNAATNVGELVDLIQKRLP